MERMSFDKTPNNFQESTYRMKILQKTSKKMKRGNNDDDYDQESRNTT
jgi:hypothetical protein